MKIEVDKNSATKFSLANTGIIKKKKNYEGGRFMSAHDSAVEYFEKQDASSQDPFQALGWLSRSNSSPHVIPALALETRPSSASPNMSRNTSAYRPGSSGRKLTPSPHHYNHPEKHMDPILIKTGIIRSRTNSITNIMEILRPKTPPSPHHHDHPLKSINLKSTPEKKVRKEMNKSKRDLNLDFMFKTDSDDFNRTQKRDIVHRENDHPIECIKDKSIPFVRKKGDIVHIPVGKVSLDLTNIFLGRLKSTFR